MSERFSALQRWGIFTVVSAIFFQATGATFASLGVALPFMIEELSWSWTNAGVGFTLLALMTGLSSTVPAWTLRRLGIKATYALAGLVMGLGFALLALTPGLSQYFLGACLLGVGYPLCAAVPAIHVLNNWFPDRRSIVIGAYMTIGAFGGVAGPLVVTGIVTATGSWRTHWWVMAACMLALAVIAVVIVKSAPAAGASDGGSRPPPEEKHAEGVHRTKVDWPFQQVLRTPQYYVIVAAMTATLFCAVTVNTWAVTHMGTLGVSTAVAAGALSAHAAVNALSRIFGGMLATRIDPKWLLVSALTAEIIGMLALAVADNPVAITTFALGEGYGFGMCYFATTILLVNYFGPRDNPEILGTLNLITTIAMLGPALGGMVGDQLGSFAIVFLAYSIVLLLILMITAVMRPPELPAARSP